MGRPKLPLRLRRDKSLRRERDFLHSKYHVQSTIVRVRPDIPVDNSGLTRHSPEAKKKAKARADKITKELKRRGEAHKRKRKRREAARAGRKKKK